MSGLVAEPSYVTVMVLSSCPFLSQEEEAFGKVFNILNRTCLSTAQTHSPCPATLTLKSNYHAKARVCKMMPKCGKWKKKISVCTFIVWESCSHCSLRTFHCSVKKQNCSPKLMSHYDINSNFHSLLSESEDTEEHSALNQKNMEYQLHIRLIWHNPAAVFG